jgi:integrase
MPRVRKIDSNPSYRLHKQSGQAIVSIPRGDGTYKDSLLGRYDSPESRIEYNRVIAEWRANSCRLTAADLHPDLTVAEVLLQFTIHAEQRYRDEAGSLSPHYLRNIRPALKPLKELYPHLPAAEFTPLKLKACRQWFIDRKFRRPHINNCVSVIKRVFAWAVEEELLRDEKTHAANALRAVKNLELGACGAKEYAKIPAVPVEHVERVLPFLNRHVAGLLRFMLATGARTGEACILRPCDLQRDGDLWRYLPSRHKTKHRGHSRVILVGAKGQAVLAEFLDGVAPEDFVFSPRRLQKERSAAMRAARQTRVPPSQQDRVKKAPKRTPGPRYCARSAQQAIDRACERAGVEKFRAYAIRHRVGTDARRAAGLDAAQAVLGHARAQTTEIYAERRDDLAAEVIRQMG